MDFDEEGGQEELFSPIRDLDFAGLLMADLQNDLTGRVSRYRQLADLSESLGTGGSMMPGGEVSYIHWTEARSSFVNGNFAATVLLTQSLAEHFLASWLHMSSEDVTLPSRIQFKDTVNRLLEQGYIYASLAVDLRRLVDLRNPLSHYRNMDDPTSLARRSFDAKTMVVEQTYRDAQFAIGVAVKLIGLPPFRIGA